MLFLDNASALVVAHPGHEIRVHGWLALARPLIFILTDGSGRTGQFRLDSTTAYLKEMGVKTGCIYGRFTDREIYRALLNHNFNLFLSLADELAEALAHEHIENVAGDAIEGYNSTHDVCRLLINAAVEIVGRTGGSGLKNYDFPVVNRPDACPGALHNSAVWLHLEEQVFQQKVAAARKYYPELVAEVHAAMRGLGDGPMKIYLELNQQTGATNDLAGLDMFRLECLRPVQHTALRDDRMRERPFYERHSERQVAAGHYEQVIRYLEHVRPLADALHEHVERSV